MSINPPLLSHDIESNGLFTNGLAIKVLEEEAERLESIDRKVQNYCIPLIAAIGGIVAFSSFLIWQVPRDQAAEEAYNNSVAKAKSAQCIDWCGYPNFWQAIPCTPFQTARCNAYANEMDSKLSDFEEMRAISGFGGTAVFCATAFICALIGKVVRFPSYRKHLVVRDIARLHGMIRSEPFLNNNSFSSYHNSFSSYHSLTQKRLLKPDIVCRLNTKQMMCVRKSIGTSAFRRQVEPHLTQKQVINLSVLTNINYYLDRISGLRENVVIDPTFFEALVQAIPQNQFDVYRRLELQSLAETANIEYDNSLLLPNLRLSIYVGAELKQSLEISPKTIHKYYTRFIQLARPNDPIGHISLDLTPVEEKGFDDFLSIITGSKEVAVNQNNAYSCFLLAQRFEICELRRICWIFLLENLPKKNQLEVITAIAPYTKVEDQNCLARYFARVLKMATAEKDFNQMQKCFELAESFHYLQLGYSAGLEPLSINDLNLLMQCTNMQNPAITNTVIRVILSKIPDRVKNITPLLLTSPIPQLYSAIEEFYSKNVNLAVLRPLWEYAQSNNSDKLTKACRDYLTNTDAPGKILKLWDGQPPADLLVEASTHKK